MTYEIISGPNLGMFSSALQYAYSKNIQIFLNLGVVKNCGSRTQPCKKPISTENVVIRQIEATGKGSFIIRGHCDADLSESQEPEFYNFEIEYNNNNTRNGKITFSR